MVKRLLGLALLAAALAGGLVYRQKKTEPFKVSGFIEADEIRIGSRVGGRIARVHVQEGQRVKTGDLLIELEPFDLLERRAEATAQAAAREADYDRLKSGFRAEEIGQAKAHMDQLAAGLDLLISGPRKEEIAAAQAQLDLAKAQLDLAQAEYKRTESLFGRKVASQEDFDRSSSQLRVAQETTRARSAELSKLQEGTRKEEIAQARAQLEEARQAWQLRVNGYRAEEIAQAKATLDAARASLAAIEKQIEELAVKAPVEGVVEAFELRPGDLVGAGAPVISLMDTSRLWVRAYVPESRLGLKVGDEARLTVDSFPGERFAGKISFIARQAEFTPSNVQTPEERSKQVFRVKVTLEEGLDRLRPGMAADLFLAPEQGAR